MQRVPLEQGRAAHTEAWAVPRPSAGSAHVDIFHLRYFTALKNPKGKILGDISFTELPSIAEHQKISTSRLQTAERKLPWNW